MYNLPSLSSLEVEGKDVSGHGVSSVAKNTDGNQGQLWNSKCTHFSD